MLRDKPHRIRRHHGSRSNRWKRFAEDFKSPGIPDEFEHRILTACMTDRALPDKDRRFQGNHPLQHAIWREALQEWEAYGAEDIKVKFRPTSQQIEDWGIVMPWCAKLEKKDFRIICLRSCGFSFVAIADRMLRTWDTRLSHDTAQRRYENAMLKLNELQTISETM